MAMVMAMTMVIVMTMVMFMVMVIVISGILRQTHFKRSAPASILPSPGEISSPRILSQPCSCSRKAWMRSRTKASQRYQLTQAPRLQAQTSQRRAVATPQRQHANGTREISERSPGPEWLAGKAARVTADVVETVAIRLPNFLSVGDKTFSHTERAVGERLPPTKEVAPEECQFIAECHSSASRASSMAWALICSDRFARAEERLDVVELEQAKRESEIAELKKR